MASACVDEGDARDQSLMEPYTDHDEPLDFQPVEGKADGVSEVFNQNLVVDDDFFTAANALTPSDIQAFLEHTPYNRRSFLADEMVGGRKFSEVLVEVAQAHQINPIMLLSRLQVEKSLVAKDSRPSGNSVDFAMGCGCPDNKPCNEAYRGIDKQIDCAATTLRTHYDGSVNGTGQWRVGKARQTLDPISITPQSHATASLYAYTPWVLQGSGGNWLVWNITKRYANALQIQVPSGPKPGFVGSPCTEDLDSLPEEQQRDYATCEFSASGENGFCFPFTTPTGEDLGVCSLMCEGYCPDQGSLITFCTELEAGTNTGMCVLKADAGNHDCADIPGTVATEVDRFVGSSTASAATARVCLPNRSESEQPPTEPPPSGLSCVGHCDDTAPVTDGTDSCYCDAGCAEYGDCCSDYQDICV
ncbi:hypothetical protein OEB96_18140 [Paraliomyxa miuraensis]|nr:hypothetical protein [Paraliomyxa miuraensis]